MTLFKRPISGFDAGLKATQDKKFSRLILLVTWPALLAAAIAIKLDSPGPLFFRQPREGFNNKRFHIVKFRSVGARRCAMNAVSQAVRCDAPVTRVGALFAADEHR